MIFQDLGNMVFHAVVEEGRWVKLSEYYEHKTSYFIISFWVTSLVESILAHISGTKFFPDIGIVHESSKDFIIDQIQKKLMTKFFNNF